MPEAKGLEIVSIAGVILLGVWVVEGLVFLLAYRLSRNP